VADAVARIAVEEGLLPVGDDLGQFRLTQDTLSMTLIQMPMESFVAIPPERVLQGVSPSRGLKR
jgi:hypothetical protein